MAAAAAVAVAGVEVEQIFNFGRMADYPPPQPRAKYLLRKRHSLGSYSFLFAWKYELYFD